jgi:hypothetical protein
MGYLVLDEDEVDESDETMDVVVVVGVADCKASYEGGIGCLDNTRQACKEVNSISMSVQGEILPIPTNSL